MPEAAPEPETPAATATEAPPKPKPRKNPPRRMPPWKVILHNDDVNEMLYVVESITLLTRMQTRVAMRKMLEAHHRGTALLLMTHQERAELYRDQFTSRNLTVTVEPAP